MFVAPFLSTCQLKEEMTTLTKNLVLLALTLALTAQTAVAQKGYKCPKREFRGAWIQCVNGQFQGMTTAQMQQNLVHQLDELQKDGANAIIFQVRPECDALYPSNIEPWSRYLTGCRARRQHPTGTLCSG